jgi:hypothetical protein
MMIFDLGVPSSEFGPVFETEARGKVRIISRKTDFSVESSNYRASARSIEELDGSVVSEESSDGVEGGSHSSRLNHSRSLNWKV